MVRDLSSFSVDVLNLGDLVSVCPISRMVPGPTFSPISTGRAPRISQYSAN